MGAARVGLAVLVALALPACSTSSDQHGDRIAPTTLGPRPALASVPCSDDAFSPAIGTDWPDVECALLPVPEDRSDDSARPLQLPVVVLRSTSSTPAADPIVYLSGGPGDRSTDAAARFVASGRGGSHDLVLLDQRGTGRTTPDLNCPEVEEVIWANFQSSDDAGQEGERLAQAYAACEHRLGSTVALDSYRSTESAHDVEDLRMALGADQVDLLAASYGTAVALETLRLHPGSVRSAVLDGVVSPGQDGDPADAADRLDDAFRRFVDGCHADPTCRTSHPDLDSALLAVRERFDRSPHRVEFQDTHGNHRTANLTGADVLRGVVQALYDAALIPLLPGFVEQLRGGDTTVLDAVGATLLGTAADPPEGLVASVNCAERGTTSDSDDLRRVTEDHPLSGPMLLPSICDAWDVADVDPSFRTVGRSEVPTLVLAGQFDPATPPDSSEDVSSRLGDRSTYVELPGLGHGALGSNACASGMIERFLVAPTESVDTSCVGGLAGPTWAG